MSEHAADGLPQIGLIAKLQLQPGDVLVLRCSRTLSVQTFDHLRDGIGSMLDKLGLTHQDVPTLILDGDLSLSVLSTGALTAQQRADVTRAIQRQSGEV